MTPPAEVDLREVWTALTIDGGKVTLQGLRFVVDARQALIKMEAVELRNSGRLDLEDCEFVQLNPPSYRPDSGDPGSRLTSVAVEGGRHRGRAAGADLPGVLLCGSPEGRGAHGRGSGQRPGGRAPGQPVPGAAHRLRVRAAWRLVPFPGQRPKANRSHAAPLRCCCWWTGRLSGWTMTSLAGWRWSIAFFPVRRMAAAAPSASAALIQQTGFEDDLRYEGRDNCYHNLSSSGSDRPPTRPRRWPRPGKTSRR